ncbi:hypothetical protein M0D44_02335 [Xanthomonas prunicola]|nr:hypothetical protein [Xanthomonas prunicola]UXA49436.1 hypothetical protein M0D44_02335 [Xanthomonas prunicola]UXA57692.1 hypothetical protein M0D47_02110 [Xanthomonas prunicola]
MIALQGIEHLAVDLCRLLVQCGSLVSSTAAHAPIRQAPTARPKLSIQARLREWTYARSYGDYDQRAAYLMPRLHAYDWDRPHASLDWRPPICRIVLPVNNVVDLQA